MATNKTQVEICKIESIGHFDVKHTRHAIYSVDFQPTPSRTTPGVIRVATAGGDFCVKIWNISKIQVDAQDLLLASLEHHTKSVNIVRWSSDGDFLASGSDDTYIIIYKHFITQKPSTSFGSQQKKNKENWIRYYTLRGHTMDVLDLDWSPREMLASGSIDNKILIWTNIDKNIPAAVVKTPARVLDGHKSFVKGVSFDPTGRYLASCCSNNLVIIWDTLEWTQVAKLTEPMKHSTDRGMFRRMSWAPDGMTLCLSAATKADKPVGMVLKRGSWESVADLVGHDAPSNCCRFLPAVLSSESLTPVCTVALADHTGLVTLWSTELSAPYLVARECFDGAATDISWMIQNRTRIAAISSLDGTLAFISLSGDVIAPMSKDQLDAHFLKLYGESMDLMKKAPEALIDNPLALKYMSSPAPLPAAPVLAPTRLSIQVPSTQSNHNNKTVLELQEVTVTRAGKKRIRPVVECSSFEMEDNGDEPVPVIAEETQQPPPPITSSTDRSPLTMRTGNGQVSSSTNGFAPRDVTAARSSGVPEVPARSFTSVAAAPMSTSLLQVTFDADKIVHQISRLEVNQSRSILVRTSGVCVVAGSGLYNAVSQSPLSLAVHVIPPPSMLLHQKTQSSLITIAHLLKCGTETLWTNVVSGEVTAMAASCATPEDAKAGLAAIGCLDGTLHILSLASGTRVVPPMVLGLAVAHVDILVNRNGKDSLLLAVSTDGDVWVWTVQESQIQCIIRTNLKPVLQSMKCRKQPEAAATAVPANGAKTGKKQAKSVEVSVFMDRCYLNAEGRVIVCMRSKGATGGDLQVFAYCPVGMVWLRQADLRHIMSSVFITPNTISSRATLTELETLQDAAIKEGGLTSAEIANISKARILAPTSDLKKYEGLITLAHVEEKLSVAFSMNSLPDVKLWLKEWVGLCTHNKSLESRLRWLLENLLVAPPIGESGSAEVSVGCSQLLLFCSGQTEQIMGLSKLNWIVEVILPALVQNGITSGIFSELEETLKLMGALP